jgi:DNA-binding transcriptional LysR family regulator
MSVSIPRSESAAAHLHGRPARLSRFKAGRKIRISGRLWMNSLGAAVAKEGAGIVRVPSRQAEVDPAAGRPVQLLVDCEPGPAPWHLVFQPSRLASPKIRNLRPLRRRRLAQPRSIQRIIQRMNRIIVQILNRAKWPWYTKPLINLVS